MKDSLKMKNHSVHQQILTQSWATRRIADLLQKQDFSTENLDAILAIGRVYGVKTRFFNEGTSREDLANNLQKIFRQQIFIKKFSTLKENQINSEKFDDSVLGVTFLNKKTFGKDLIFQNLTQRIPCKLHLFSPALRQLFVNFPENNVPKFSDK